MTSGATSTPTQAAATDLESSRVGGGAGGLGWRRLQLIAAALTFVSLMAPMVITGELAGFLVAMAAPFLIGLSLGRFLPRVAAIFIGIVSAAVLASSAAFIPQALSHPESAADFIPLTFLTLSLLIGAVAAIPAFREARRRQVASRKPRLLAIVTAAVAVAASVVSLAAASLVTDVTPEPGDQILVTRGFVFAPTTLTAESGTISVHVTNDDPTRHTFTIDGVADLNVPPNSTQRVTFEASPGTYRFYCRPHAPDMDGVLVVD